MGLFVSSSWRRRGTIAAAFLALVSSPARGESWTAVGPPGGSVRALAADPQDPRRVYLGTACGILYRSDDRGIHWQRLTPGFPRRGCSLDDIVVGERGTVFVGFWDVDGNGGGVARSTDGGRTFTTLRGISGESVRALAIAPSDPRTIAAGTRTGLFVSRDGGRGWKRVTPADHPDLRNIESVAFDPRDPRVIYLGTWHLGWKTPDGGATWGPLHNGMIDDSDVMTLTVERDNPEVVYASACTGIYRSMAGAKEWTRLVGIPYGSRRTRAFAESDDGNLLIAGTTEGLWISENQGGTWRRTSPREMVVNALLVEPDGTILAGAEDAGVLRSDDRGRSWTASNAGFSEWLVSGIVFDDANRRVLLGVRGDARYGGVFSSSSARGPWSREGQGLEGRQVLALLARGDTLLAGTDDGIFLRDARASAWTRAPGAAGGQDANPHVTELIAPSRDHIVAATSRGVLQSSDGGQSWTSRELDGTEEVHGLAASPAEPQRMLAATRSGLFESLDGGAQWRALPSWPAGVMAHALAFSPADPQVVFATTSAGLFRSDDRGASWQLVTGGIPPSDLTGIAIHPDGRTLYVTDFTLGGVFRSVDSGSTWKRMPIDGLASDRVWTLALDPAAPEQVLVGSSAGGLHLLAAPSAAAHAAASVGAGADAGSAASP